MENARKSPRARVRIFLGISNRTDWLPRKLKALHMAVWLGSLDAPDLNDVTGACYGTSSDFGGEKHNLRGFFNGEETVPMRIFPGCRSLLVAAAGGGREAIALAKSGFEITAFDSSEALIKNCRNNVAKAGVEARILHSRPDDIPDDLGIYDGLVVGRGAYHHIPGRRSRIRFLEKCREHLAPNSPVFLNDFFVLPIDASGAELTMKIARFVRRIRNSRYPVELGDQLNAQNFYHLFRRCEIEDELHEAGYRLKVFAATPWSDGDNLAHAVATAVDEHESQTL